MPTVEEEFQTLWDEKLADELADERSRGYSPERFYHSGRKSKLWPEGEGPAWWFEHGPAFVKSWARWRELSELRFWTAPDGAPGIELPVRAFEPGCDCELYCVIDRVMVDASGALYIIDLKSGSHQDAWPRQIALNNLGLMATYGVRARFGGFWSARKGAVVPMFDLRTYDDAWMWDQVHRARLIRDNELFVAQPTNLCNSACGVRDYCKAVGGSLSMTVPQQSHSTSEEAE